MEKIGSFIDETDALVKSAFILSPAIQQQMQQQQGGQPQGQPQGGDPSQGQGQPAPDMSQTQGAPQPDPTQPQASQDTQPQAQGGQPPASSSMPLEQATVSVPVSTLLDLVSKGSHSIVKSKLNELEQQSGLKMQMLQQKAQAQQEDMAKKRQQQVAQQQAQQQAQAQAAQQQQGMMGAGGIYQQGPMAQ